MHSFLVAAARLQHDLSIAGFLKEMARKKIIEAEYFLKIQS